jgi:N,N'-diacetyllegionaminate synthase
MKLEVVAELAQGFEGRAEQARLLVKAAAAAGADAAKFQLVYADELATPDYEHYVLFRSLEMVDEIWEGLASYATEVGIRLHLDIFGTRSLRLAERIGVAAIKVHGTDIANAGLLGEVAASSVQRVVLGAGGAHASELQQALAILAAKQVVVLVGFQGYPTAVDANQIARVRFLVQRVAQIHPNVAVGFADHALPDTPLRYALAATAIGAGATVIEKHLTLSRNMKLEDHEAALNPDEFSEFTQVVRSCAAALGESSDADDFGMSSSERGYRNLIRRHVVTSRDLSKNSMIVPTDVVLKRTAAEDVLTDLGSVYQKQLRADLRKNSPISPADIA